ncbi:response regulator [Vibrio sp. SS-MA-C1-2]|uniref:response regulator n=1 Tax=Vibrio sp. SS-MA-C1-2 TaxID=2908646 RepID=UPI001F2F5852|nr:response regulator [Vibrio sp. SS-MA-C1-2]UJF19415.1 response regulator [Vibrio sp. SS-MA-C1-2]
MSHILLVDDDIELTSLLNDILTLEGFTVSEANDGEAGLAALTPDVDLILLDIMMPNMNGLEMLSQLRKEHETPVLMLTAKGDEIDRVLGLELGADDYLPKPFSDRELLARIRAILRRSQQRENQSNTDTITYQGITIELGKQEVYCQNTLIDLTSTELILLTYFINHPSTIISKSDLSLNVLGKHLAPFDRAIDVHVSNIRKKLPPREDGKDRIKTLRGRGYMLIEE